MTKIEKKFCLEKQYIQIGPRGQSRTWLAADFWAAVGDPKHAVNRPGFGFLVATMEFDCDWTTWEMHPKGDEVVTLLEGQCHFIFELPQRKKRMLLKAGDSVVVPKGIWHTVRTVENCRALFITPGEGTQNRPVSC